MKKLSFKEYIIKVTPEGGVFSESRVELEFLIILSNGYHLGLAIFLHTSVNSKRS